MASKTKTLGIQMYLLVSDLSVLHVTAIRLLCNSKPNLHNNLIFYFWSYIKRRKGRERSTTCL